MLTDEERSEIEAEITNYPYKRSACVEALKIVQKRQGWVSDEDLKDVADFLEMTVDEVDGVATFYNLIFRRPVGRHVIYLCNSVSCWLMGYPRLYHQLKERLGIDFGETTPNGQFTLLPIVCLGDCDHAPALMVDEKLYHDLDIDETIKVLDKYTG